MQLYWAPRTRASRAVWMLEELALDYELITVDIRTRDRNAHSAFRHASPMAKVPALVDGDVALSESAAICLYLADRYAGGIMAPAIDDVDRGRFLYWMFFTPAVLEPAMGEKVNNVKPNRTAHGWGDFNSMIDTLESGLGDREWLMGDNFTAADVMVGSSAAFLKMFDLLPLSLPIDAYIDRCLARPAYQKALATDAEAVESA